MAQLVRDLIHGYTDIMENKSDPRVNHWSMMSSPFPTLAICLFYVYFSKVLGPRIMENRKPFQLRQILIVYNCVQTLFSAWIFYEMAAEIKNFETEWPKFPLVDEVTAIDGTSKRFFLKTLNFFIVIVTWLKPAHGAKYLQSGWAGHYSFRCQPVDYSNSPMALRMARTCWWYYFSKFTEFFDTLFFILRKKFNQVSNLHVIHHGCMPMSVWMGMKFAPGGHSTFFALLNTFVHIIMYFYYMVAAMGPQFQKYLWWKKYLTTVQMVQFVLIFGHQFQLLFTECNYPKGFMVWIGLHGILFLFLFSDFYKTHYRASRSQQPRKDTGLCMPLLEETKKSSKEERSREISSDYATEYSETYSNCYSNGVNNGYMSAAKSNITDRNRKEK